MNRSSGGLGWAHRIWFALVLLASLAFLVFIPPFQTNDEPSHWQRVWTVACGQLTCGRQLPIVVERTLEAAHYGGVRHGHAKFQLDWWRDMRAIKGSSGTMVSGGNACVYVPVAYLLPALAMRAFVHPYDWSRPAGMFAAFYAARVANWLLMGAGVLLFLIYVPRLRNLTLVLYSLPTVMQQTVVVNQESTLFVLMFALVALWAARPRLRHVIGVLVIVTILSAMKAVFLVLLLLWAALILRWRRVASARWFQVLGVASLALIPLVVQALWTHYVVRVSGREYLPGWGVNPELQMSLLRQHPLNVFPVLWEAHKNLFTEKHMHGGWTSVLGVLGWAEIEIGARAYAALLVATVIAVVADARVTAPPVDENVWLRWIVPWLSSYLLLPAVMMAMYLVFTAVGGPSPLGVQGRYLVFPYFLMLAIPLDYVQRRWSTARPLRALDRVGVLLPWLCAALCLFADQQAWVAIRHRFY